MLLTQLEKLLGPCKETGSGELNFCCPSFLCEKRKGTPDTKYHLYVNPTRVIHGIKGWFYCHRCRSTGPISKLLGYTHSDKIKHEVHKWDQFLNKLKPTSTKHKDPVLMPEDFRPIIKNTEAYKYLKNRGLSDDKIKYYRIGFGTQSLKDLTKEERRRYAGSGRIVFPDYGDDGELVYWVARTYRNHKIKYKNPFGHDARDKLYNLAGSLAFSYVIIVEGVMSAIAAGKHAVATYGKDVTPSQVSMLVAASFKRYYVALDGDALKHEPGMRGSKPPAIKLAEELTRRGCDTFIVTLPYEHDPDSVDDFRSYIDNAKRFDLKTAAELMMEVFS